MSGEPSGSEGFAWIRMLWTLNNNNTVEERLQTDALAWLLSKHKRKEDHTWMPGGML